MKALILLCTLISMNTLSFAGPLAGGKNELGLIRVAHDKETAYEFTRSADSADEVKMIFSYQYTVRHCARYMAYTNPLSGELGAGCAFYTSETKTKKKSLTVDFGKASQLAPGEEQSVRIALKRKSHYSGKLEVKVEIVSGPSDSVEKRGGVMSLLFGQKFSIVENSNRDRVVAGHDENVNSQARSDKPQVEGDRAPAFVSNSSSLAR